MAFAHPTQRVLLVFPLNDRVPDLAVRSGDLLYTSCVQACTGSVQAQSPQGLTSQLSFILHVTAEEGPAKMSVVTRNPFALLDDDASRPSTPPSAPKAEPAPAAQPTRGGQRGRGGAAARGGRYYQRGGARTGAPRDGDNAEGNADDAAGEGKKRFDGEGRGRGRGRGRGDRGRGGRGRPFDRHSATGKTDSDKKVHQGWGGDEGGSELKAEAGGATDAAVEATTGDDTWGAAPTNDGWGSADAPAEGEAAAAAAPTEGDKPAEGRRGRDREPEEEDNTLTLEQYLKQQKDKELEIIPKLETRKANEGDDSIWKDAVAITKKDEEEDAYFVGKSKTAPKARAKKDEKVFIEIDARFERPRGGRGGRGGDRGDHRGGDRARGGRGRGGRGRANGTSAPALDVDDQAAFPSLA
ncbi:hypothetical protein EIP91_008870 [Steccherinum ochraceum]|uniref:Hyaluronan/mRNA-binding protein domain-containing protein n=1 Tax=Steccherinum ochraceum TaxID=92696 RepID=A0A4R0RRG6_9APHY|nr:hypothetical protein EIP91_008870 [Steccherinum ochraceum]